MLLFIISFLLITLSSYFCSSLIEKSSCTKTKPLFIYMFLSGIAQVILTFEILSLFGAVNRINFLILNIVFLIISASVVKLKKIELFSLDIKGFLSDIKKAVDHDKMLIAGLFSLLFFIILAFILALISPVSISDAMAYHMPRAVNWIINGSLSHFMTNDMRMNTMPINSELLYAWIILFFKSDVALGLVSFAGYLNTITVLYCFLGELGYCVRKRLWTVFVFSGLAFVVIETPGCDTNIFTGSLVLTALYLFYKGIKYRKNGILFASALALSVSCGVKTTAVIALPAIGVFMIFISALFKGKNFYKPLLTFGLFFLVNFMIFSSYNYILNYIDYNSFTSTSAQYEYHRFRGGVKGYLSSLIKYLFMLCNFSGISFASHFGKFSDYLSDVLHLLILGVPADTYASVWYPDSDMPINSYLLETKVGTGLTGIIAFFPSIIISWFGCRKLSKRHIMPLFAYMYLINILLFSGIVFYTEFNSRYLTTFAVISSPILVLSYIKSYKNLFKWFILLTCSYYLIVASQNNPYRLVSEILTELKNTHSIVSVRHKLRGSSVSFSDDELSVIRLRNYIAENKFKNIAFFSNYGDLILPLDILRLYGHEISYMSFENLDDVNLSDYDMVVVHTMFQQTDNIRKYYSDNNSLITQGVKVYYDNKNDISCYYVDYMNKVTDKNSKNIPVFVNCPIPIEKFDELGYRVAAVFRDDKYSPIEAVSTNPDNKDYAVYIKTGKL